MNITSCDGLPTGVISCEEDSVVKCKFINTALFSNYRFLYSYVFIRDNINKNNVAYGRIVHINTDTGEAYIDDSLNVANSDYVYTADDYRYFIYEITDATVEDFTNDCTVELGNKTNIKPRAAKQFDTRVAANHYWNYYNINDIDINHEQSSDNKILTITSILNINNNDIYADGYKVGGTVKYKITGLTDGQTIVFKREKGNLTITTDGTYDVEWGTNNVQRNIYFGKRQEECNITIEIISAPAYTLIQNQVTWNVPHWRGFNVFWYGDIWINLDNMLNKNNYDTDKDEKIWYYTDDISKFDDTIDNKEHQIKGLGKANNDWLKEVRINDKGDIVPSKLYYDGEYKNSYHHNDNYDSINCTVVGGRYNVINYNGLLFLSTNNSIYVPSRYIGFVKVTILD